MNTLKALLWKEWRQQRWFLLIGFIFFWIVPIIAISIQLYQTLTSHRVAYNIFEIPNALTICFGGLFAIILATGIICDELNNNLSNFWQSRPISLTQWILVKYLFGFGILIVSCVLCFALPLKIIAIFEPLNFIDKMAIPIYHTFTLILIYSSAFLIGSLVRQTLNAIILSVGAGLLIYFLPVVFPPLSFLSVFNIIVQGQSDWSKEIEHRSYINLMLAGSATLLIFSLLSLHYNWQIRMGKPLMFWSLGGVFLILLGSAGFQLSSNLTCERQITFPPIDPGHTSLAYDIVMTKKDQGIVLEFNQQGDKWKKDQFYLHQFDLSQPKLFQKQRINLGPRQLTPKKYQSFRLLGSSDYPNHAYLLKVLSFRDDKENKKRELLLTTVQLNHPKNSTIINELDLSSYFPYDCTPRNCCLYKDAIYIFWGSNLVRISLTNPDQPEVTTVLKEPSFGMGEWTFDHELGYWKGHLGFAYQKHPIINTLKIPGLNNRERLELTIKLMQTGSSQEFALNNDLLICQDKDQQQIGGRFELRFTTYRLEQLEANEASFTLISRKSPSPLEQLIRRHNSPQKIILNHEFAWVKSRAGITVYDVRQPERPRRAGHFASSGEQFQTMTPLPDGRMLLGGEKLYILAPPKR